MAKRMAVMLSAVAVFVLGVGAVKLRMLRGASAQAASFQPPPEAVTTIVAREESWPAVLEAIGTVSAVQGVTVSADLPGVVTAIAFDSGRTVKAGDLLVQLDTRQERAQLAAAEAARALAALSLERARGLRDEGVVSQADYDRVLAEHAQAEARVGEIRATIERKQVVAPFDGLLGIRRVDLGQYLQAGQPIVPLQALHPVHVDFGVPQQEVARIRVGRAVRVTSDAAAGAFEGRISAVDSEIDAATRNARVRATLDNRDGRLRPGMFVEAHLLLGTARSLVSLPASAVAYAPYGDSVFLLAPADGQGVRTVRQQFVKLAGTRGDRVGVLSGLAAGAEVVTSGVFKLRPGAAVRVDNSVQPANDPEPRLEDN